MKRYAAGILYLLTFGLQATGTAQSLSAFGFEPIEQALRRDQLIYGGNSTLSLAQRPISSDVLDSAQFLKGVEFSHGLSIKGAEGIKLRVLPARTFFRYNSFAAYGRNDGALTASRGYQNITSAGFHARYRQLELQLASEFMYSGNKLHEGFPNTHYDIIWARRYVWWNKTDIPERFPKPDETKFRLGQSHLKYSFKQLEFGVSTQNIWWGPSKRNAIVMSNNAAGFGHFFAGSKSPVSTPVGSFEGQLLVGKLENSGVLPPQADREYFDAVLYHPKRKGWRYISGLNLVWHPKWVDGFFIGANRTKQLYKADLQNFVDYIPVLSPRLDNITSISIDETSTDQYSSVYSRWVFKEERAEFYAEYGAHGQPRKMRDWLVEPNRNRGYTFGFAKLFQTRRGRFFQLESEITQLQQPDGERIDEADSWYTSETVRHGYTHRGQVLGAGIGPGSSSQFLAFSWVENVNRIGVSIERVVNNNDFIYYAFSETNDYRRHWVDFAGTVSADWRIGNVVASASIAYTRAINYQWELPFVPGAEWFRNGRDINNLQLGISTIYLFNARN